MTVSNAFVLAHGSVNAFTIYHSKSGDFYYSMPLVTARVHCLDISESLALIIYPKAYLNKIVSPHSFHFLSSKFLTSHTVLHLKHLFEL